MANLATQENISMEKFAADLKEQREKQNKRRAAMSKKLVDKKFDFQRDWEVVEKDLKGKELSDDEIYLKALCLRIAPMVSGASIQIRSAFEKSLPGKKRMKLMEAMPKTIEIQNGIMALLEPEIKKLCKDLKKYYEKETI